MLLYYIFFSELFFKIISHGSIDLIQTNSHISRLDWLMFDVKNMGFLPNRTNETCNHKMK